MASCAGSRISKVSGNVSCATRFGTDPDRLVTAGPVSLKLWHGDGIFFADPVRAVVVDAQGILLAASPVFTSLQIGCGGARLERRCLAYDSLPRIVYETRPGMWDRWGLIEQDGKPNSYPEHVGEAFGFSERPATIAEIVWFEIAGILQLWPAAVMAIAWWTLFWLLLLPLSQRKPSRPGVVAITLRLIGAALMALVARYDWFIMPYSPIYFSFVFLMGALIAHILGGGARVTPKPA